MNFSRKKHIMAQFFRLTLLIFTFLLHVFPVSMISKAIAESSSIYVQGRWLKDSNDRIIELRGINFETHTWAYQESYYDPATKKWTYSQPESSLDNTIKYMADWVITQEDFMRVRSWGANMVRLQVPHYMFDSIGQPYSEKDYGYQMLDQWISWAETFGLFVILDMHVPHGGRQFVDRSEEGITFWRNIEEQNRFRNLWRRLATRYQNHPKVLFQLMNEPSPERLTGKSDDWWSLAQNLIYDIRAVGSDNIIILSSTLADDSLFRICNDPAGNLMYDVHFYKPYEFTHQEAFWINPRPPSVSYPTSIKEYFAWTDPLNKENDGNYKGSSIWQEWSETINRANPKLPNPLPSPVFLSPGCNSWNNSGMLCFDNCRVFIDNVEYPIYNHDMEIGPPSSGWTPQGWGEYKSKPFLEPVRWVEDSGNHYVEIPPTPGETNHNLSLMGQFAIKVPENFSAIRITGSVKGSNTAKSTVFGVSWYKEKLYNQNTMKADLAPYINFGKTNNVPVMCLEFGVIMNATPEEGHLRWLEDLGQIFHENGLHFAYHVYRALADGNEMTSFGVYQCWGRPASECQEKFEFVIPTLKKLFEPCMLTLMRTGSGSGRIESTPPGIICGTECSESFPLYSEITLKAIPDPGSNFVGWSGGSCSGTQSSCKLFIDDDTTVTATFNKSAPSPPSNLSCKAIGPNHIFLGWQDNSTNENGFIIERKVGNCSSTNPWTRIAVKTADIKTHTDTDCSPDTNYSYRIRSYNSTGYSPFSNCNSTRTGRSGTPLSPTNLIAKSVSTSMVNLRWTDNASNETGFKIYKKTGNGTWSLMKKVNANVVSCRDTEATGNNGSLSYQYYIVAYNAVGNSPPTHAVVIPFRPTNLKVICDISQGTTQLTWKDNSTNETGFAVYQKREYCSSQTPWSLVAILAPNTTNYFLTDFTASANHAFMVKAYYKSANPKAYGYSLESNCVLFTAP